MSNWPDDGMVVAAYRYREDFKKKYPGLLEVAEESVSREVLRPLFEFVALADTEFDFSEFLAKYLTVHLPLTTERVQEEGIDVGEKVEKRWDERFMARHILLFENISQTEEEKKSGPDPDYGL